MGLFTRISTATRNALGNVAVRTLNNSVAKGYNLPATAGGDGSGGWFSLRNGGGGVDGPHEPFTGAWQRNMDAGRAAAGHLLSNSAIYTCTNVISSDIAILPLQVLRPSDSPGIREPHYNHPAWGLMQRPNSFQTSLHFVQHYMMSKLVFGNAYVLLTRDNRYVPTAMYVLDPSCVQILISDDGAIFYRLGRDVMAGTGDSTIVPASEIIHDRMMPIGSAGQGSALVGTSPLYAAAMSGMMNGRIQTASETFFANMSRTSGVLVAPGKIEPTIARQLQQEWEANYSGRGLGKTAVLTNGLEFKPMSVNAADSELVAQLRWTIEDIARVYQVPQYRVGEMSKATYRNSEQMSRDYYRNCLAYHIKSFEQSFNRGLGLTGGVVVEFDLSDMFRMESDTRFASYQVALNAGFMAINEVRALEDLPPVAGGDEPRVQMQYVTLSQADKIADVSANPPAPAAPSPSPSPAPAPAAADDKQMQLDFEGFEPEQLDLLAAAFGDRFSLSENRQNGA